MELEKLLTQKIKVNISYRIDALKGIAIIAVVLYHFGGGGGPTVPKKSFAIKPQKKIL